MHYRRRRDMRVVDIAMLDLLELRLKQLVCRFVLNCPSLIGEAAVPWGGVGTNLTALASATRMNSTRLVCRLLHLPPTVLNVRLVSRIINNNTCTYFTLLYSTLLYAFERHLGIELVPIGKVSQSITEFMKTSILIRNSHYTWHQNSTSSPLQKRTLQFEDP